MGFFNKGEAPPYPGLPASLRSDSFEMQNIKLDSQAPSAPLPPQQHYDSAADVTPYLGLRARLSQIWFNRWTVLLVLVLVRVVLLVGGLNDSIDSAQDKALAACTKVEDVGSAMASMPHYLSVGVNDLAADGISKAVQGMVALLEMILTGVEQLILFVINFYIGTYVCLSSALVHGGLDIGIGAADEVTELMNDAISGITKTLEDDVSSVQDTINSVFSEIASASSIFGKTFKAPSIDLAGPIADLQSIKVDDTSFVQTLQKLNASIPTYDQAEDFAKEAISIPFKAVKTLLNTTYGGYTFDTSVFPVAKKTALTFCSDNDTISGFFDKLYAIAAKAKTGFVVVLALLAVLACVPMTYLEIRRYRSQLRRAKVLTQHGFDPMDVVYIAGRPFSAAAGIRAAARFHAGRRQLLARWAFAYATSLPALFVLSLALTGLVSCACQAILLRAIQNEAPALAEEVADFAGSVVATLESVSGAWAGDANAVLLNFQDDINHDVLGYVVNATTAVNNTLNVFTDEIADGINAAFNGTVLENTVTQIVRCLIGIKIDAIEDGLTWVHDHAHVSLPRFPNNTFSVGAKDSISNDTGLSSFLAQGNSSAVSSDDITAAVDKVVDSLRNGLVQAVLISLALLLLYVIVVLIGIVWALFGMMRPDRTRGDGGQRYYADGTDPVAQANSMVPEPAPFFPRFDGGAETAAVDDATAAQLRDEKLDAALRTTQGHKPGGSVATSSTGQRVVYEKKGHWRSSSYGDMDDAGGR